MRRNTSRPPNARAQPPLLSSDRLQARVARHPTAMQAADFIGMLYLTSPLLLPPVLAMSN